MQIFPIFTAVLALALKALADSDKFEFVTLVTSDSKVWKDSPLENGHVYIEDSKFLIDKSKSPISGVIDNEGHIKLSDGSYVDVKNSGDFSKGDKNSATAGFSAHDGDLRSWSFNEYFAVKDGKNYVLSQKQINSDDVKIVIRVQSPNGGTIPNFL